MEQRGQLPGALRVNVRQRPEVDGVYIRRRGEVQGGQPVWAHADCRVYSSSNGHWMVAVGLAAVERGAGILSSATPHGSKMPHEVFDWLVLADDKWLRDESVIIMAEGAATA
eukprot:gene8323-4030_t